MEIVGRHVRPEENSPLSEEHTMERPMRMDFPRVDQGVAMPEGGWTFAGIVDKFDEHIRRSIPLCEEGRRYVADLSTFFVSPRSLVYELGVSTGALAKQVLERNQNKHFRYVGIDIVPEMTVAAGLNLQDDPRFIVETADVMDYGFQTASLFLSYYTVQFIPPKSRQTLINKVYEKLEWGGAFIMYEKVRGPDARFQDILTQLYAEFKLDNGFSPDEIFNKTKALKGVLEPFSTMGNLGLLSRAGFHDVMLVHKFYCFEGYLAIK